MRNQSPTCSWTMLVVEDFLISLMNITLSKDLYELKNHSIPDFIWDEVSEIVDIDSESLKNVWFNQLHIQLFCPRPVYMNETKVKLIEYLYKEEVQYDRDLDWDKLQEYFDGYTIPYLNCLYDHLINVAKKELNTDLLRELIKYLLFTYIPLVINQDEDKILPRLQYVNGKLCYNEEDIIQIKKHRL